MVAPVGYQGSCIPHRGVRQIALVLICSEASAQTVDTTAAAPPMSPRIMPMPSEGLIEIPPLITTCA